MALHAHMSHEVVPDALPYVDQGYSEPDVREMVRLIASPIMFDLPMSYCIIYFVKTFSCYATNDFFKIYGK